MNGVEPYAYLKTVLEAIAAGHPAGFASITLSKAASSADGSSRIGNDPDSRSASNRDRNVVHSSALAEAVSKSATSAIARHVFSLLLGTKEYLLAEHLPTPVLEPPLDVA